MANLVRVAVIEGDDAAPEAVRPVIELLSSLQLGIEWVYPIVGESAIDQFGSPFPEESKHVIDDASTTFFGSTSGKSGAALMYLRWGKRTYPNVRPCKYLPGCASPLKSPDGIDFAFVRENLEDLYVAVEGDLEELEQFERRGRTIRTPLRDLGEGKYAIKAITRTGTERVVRFALDLAGSRRRKLTCVTKHNMLRESDGFFLDVARSLAESYADIEFESYIVDDFACRLIREPQKYDVVVMPNMYGDILSDAAGGLLGSLGLAASGCYGDDYAYFEPAHGTAPDIQGQNIINPTATLLSACMMLEYLDMPEPATKIRDALAGVYERGEILTPDQGGNTTTGEFVMAVGRQI